MQRSTTSPERRMRELAEAATWGGTEARERLVAQAFVLFYARGIRAVGVDLLIERSGVAKATFYRHFSSKSDLISAYLDRRHAAWLAWLAEEVDRVADRPEDRLLTLFDVLEVQFADPDFNGLACINAVSELGSEVPQVLTQAQGHQDQLHVFVGGLVRAAGVVAPEALAKACVLLIEGAVVEAQRSRSAASAVAAGQVVRGLLELELGRS